MMPVSDLRSATTPAKRRSWGTLIVTIIALAVSVGWVLVARQRLDDAITRENEGYLARARAVFDLVRSESQTNVRTQSRVLAEDPRLKSTLATEGIDEATIADILVDLNGLRRSGFLLILSPEGKVLGQAGAPELRGLDLASSSLVKKARTTSDAISGAWVIAGKVHDLAVVNVRFGTDVIAYLVVGRTLDASLLTAVSNSTGVGFAIVMGDRVAIASTDEPLGPVFDAIAKRAHVRELDSAGQRYLVSLAELEGAAQMRPRLVLVRSMSSTTAAFSALGWLLVVPPIVLLTTIVLVVFLLRGPRRESELK